MPKHCLRASLRRSCECHQAVAWNTALPRVPGIGLQFSNYSPASKLPVSSEVHTQPAALPIAAQHPLHCRPPRAQQAIAGPCRIRNSCSRLTGASNRSKLVPARQSSAEIPAAGSGSRGGDALANCSLLRLRTDAQVTERLHEAVQGRARVADRQLVLGS
jgi:hypothetical protein